MFETTRCRGNDRAGKRIRQQQRTTVERRLMRQHDDVCSIHVHLDISVGNRIEVLEDSRVGAGSIPELA